MSTLPKEVIVSIIADGQLENVGDIYAYLKDLFKDTLQEMLEAELDVSLGYAKNGTKNKKTDNQRNGHSHKTVKSQHGEIELEIPRDRKSQHEPKIVPKFKRDVSGIEEQIITLYSRKMSTQDIRDQVKDIYGIEVSAEMVSKNTKRLIPEIKEWQNRPLEPIYLFVFMDAIHYKKRVEKLSMQQILLKVCIDILERLLSQRPYSHQIHPLKRCFTYPVKMS